MLVWLKSLHVYVLQGVGFFLMPWQAILACQIWMCGIALILNPPDEFVMSFWRRRTRSWTVERLDDRAGRKLSGNTQDSGFDQVDKLRILDGEC